MHEYFLYILILNTSQSVKNIISVLSLINIQGMDLNDYPNISQLLKKRNKNTPYYYDCVI